MTIATLVLLLPAGCATAQDLQIGMTETEVVRILGEPDRKAVLLGKVLHDVSDVPADELSDDDRVVYFYEVADLQLWFQHEKVTGIIRSGVSTIDE